MYSIDDILNGDIDEIAEDDNINDGGSILSDDNDDIEQVNVNNDNAEEEVKKEENEEDKPAKKVRKASVRPVLNAERLKRPRGLICMEKIFSELKFKGHGHEQEDLDTLMTALQHWSHRLYPKFTFDDALYQIEKLGAKRPVITLKKKIIYNMLDDEIFGTDEKRDVDEPDTITQPISPPRMVDQFDLLLSEDPPPVRERLPSPELKLTEEQKEIIERNRHLAAEKRRAKLEAMQSKQEEHLQDSSSHEDNMESEMTMLE